MRGDDPYLQVSRLFVTRSKTRRRSIVLTKFMVLIQRAQICLQAKGLCPTNGTDQNPSTLKDFDETTFNIYLLKLNYGRN